jgi:hypothetical protein
MSDYRWGAIILFIAIECHGVLMLVCDGCSASERTTTANTKRLDWTKNGGYGSSKFARSGDTSPCVIITRSLY